MSKITSITVKRSANLGHFESVEIAVAASVDADDVPGVVLKKLHSFIDAAIENEVKVSTKIPRNETEDKMLKGARVWQRRK